jgi:hypothetical protein
MEEAYVITKLCVRILRFTPNHPAGFHEAWYNVMPVDDTPTS